MAWEESFPGAGNTLCKGMVDIIIFVLVYKVVDKYRALSFKVGPVPLGNAESKPFPRPTKSQSAFPRWFLCTLRAQTTDSEGHTQNGVCRLHYLGK